MNNFSKKVLLTIDKHNMIKKGSTVIAAVSGGFDSVCMLSVLYNLSRLRRFTVCAAHLNHDFRSEADDDERFVIDLCNGMGIKVYTKKTNVQKYALKKRMSFETAGRDLRYAFFDELLNTIPNSIAATAHNANDNAESFIMHLLRGSGLTGLTGIKPVRGKIIRPLIEQSRADIEQYCIENNLKPKTDYTNFDERYTRNDIRLNVMPHLESRGGMQAIVKTANLLSTDEEFLSHFTKQIFTKHVDVFGNKHIIDIKEFNRLHLSIKRRLIKFILDGAKKQAGLVHIDTIISIAKKNHGGKQALLPGGIIASISRGKLIIIKE